MINNPIYKKYLLYATLFLTLLATAYFKYQDSLGSHASDIVETPFVSNNANKMASEYVNNSTDVNNDALAKVDIFEVYKKTVPDPVVKEAVKANNIPKPVPVIPVATPPPPPTAPSVPFKYIGKILGDDEYQVFVAFNGKYLVVKEGDIIQQTYKIEKISPPIMTMTYIPMNILQNMQIGEPN